MSGPSTYNPNSGFEKWIDQRLPLPRLLHDTVHTFPTPRNLNIWYTFGGILAFCLGIQIITGIVLAMHYVANANLAFDSCCELAHQVKMACLARLGQREGAVRHYAIMKQVFERELGGPLARKLKNRSLVGCQSGSTQMRGMQAVCGRAVARQEATGGQPARWADRHTGVA